MLSNALEAPHLEHLISAPLLSVGVVYSCLIDLLVDGDVSENFAI